MIIRIEDLKAICSTILTAVDSNELSKLTETLELKVVNNILYLNVTNKEYYARVKFGVNENINFHATVNANLFLKLIAQTTSDTVKLEVNDTNLEVIGNGSYKLPLIFDDDKLLELPEIVIDNITSEFDIDFEILNSIYKYNSKELSKGIIAKPVQNMYYIDEEGCITFTSGACVNAFTLPQPIKLLLNNRIVKLFKLFKGNKIHFKLGFDPVTTNMIQTKVSFESDNICVTAIIANDTNLISTVPVTAIRQRASFTYPYSILINKNLFNQAINRMLLFTEGYGSKEAIKPYSKFVFNSDSVVIYDVNNINSEELAYSNQNSGITDSYECILDLTDLKLTLENYSDEYLNIRFGNNQAIVITKNNIFNIIPECHNV